jgi:N4-gp56 family major capsid protein
MALNFIPAVWSARILQALDKALVYGQIDVVNRDYEGEIREAGNTVKIASIGNITVNDYIRDTDIGDPQILSDSDQMLVIDQQKYFNFYVDSIDRAQTNINIMDEAMRRAAYALRDQADQYVASLMDAAVPTANKIGSSTTPVVPTATSAYEYLVDLSTLLDEANVPTEGRWCVVPPWFHGLMLKDPRFVAAGSMQTDQRIANGEVGEAAGFRILKSNNVPNLTGTKYRIIAGHPIATSYAEQILDVQNYKPEKRFGDAVKGLHVYGAKVVQPNALAEIIANKS